jgi:hypothetical protein
VTVLTVRLCRTEPEANPAALVAAWLVDALAGAGTVCLTLSMTELIRFDIDPIQTQEPVIDIIRAALAEPRFAGWQVLGE